MIRKTGKLILGAIITVFLSAGVLWVPVLADGGAYVSDASVSVAEGETVYVSVGVDNATGSYVITSDGSAAANGSGWLDNETATIGIYGASSGSGVVTVNFPTLATYDEDNLDGTTLSIYVNVYKPDTPYEPDKGDDTPAGGDTPQEETTTTDPVADPEKYLVTINNEEYTLLTDLTGVDIPKGFVEDEGIYQGERVKVVKYGDDLTLYVLRKTKDNSILYEVYDEQKHEFQSPKAVVLNENTYYLLDVPEGAAPDGYTKKDIKIGDFTVSGYVSDTPDYKDFYFVRAIADGQIGYYSYDTKQGTIQRFVSLEEIMDANELLQAAEDEAELAAAKAAEKERILMYALMGAAGVVVILVIILIVVSVRKKRDKDFDDFNDLVNHRADDEDYYPDGIEDDFTDFDDSELERDWFADEEPDHSNHKSKK